MHVGDVGHVSQSTELQTVGTGYYNLWVRTPMTSFAPCTNGWIAEPPCLSVCTAAESIMLLTFFFTSGIERAQLRNGYRAQPVAAAVGRAARVAQVRAAAAYSIRQGVQLSPDASCREISVDTCRRVLLWRRMPVHLLFSVAGVGGPPQMQHVLAQGQHPRPLSTPRTRLLASSKGLAAEAALLGGRRRS
ncbi:hypothetical protein Q7P35_010105 [Cladosporium inversicolor]